MVSCAHETPERRDARKSSRPETTPDCVPDVNPAIDLACPSPVRAGTGQVCSIKVQGRSREFLLYAPANFDPCVKTPLVVDAHGATETMSEHAGLEPFNDWPGGLGSGWRLVADREGFLVAQPQGIGNRWVASDVAFMESLVLSVRTVADLDAERIYMTGISNGGELTYQTGCGEGNVFRGFASISGFGRSCAVTRPAPVIHFHSAEDSIISYDAGLAAFARRVEDLHCQRGPISSVTFGGANGSTEEVCLAAGSSSEPFSLVPCEPSAGQTRCQQWDECDGGVQPTFCTVAADRVNHFDTTGGHILYFNDTSLSVAAVAWSYFEKMSE